MPSLTLNYPGRFNPITVSLDTLKRIGIGGVAQVYAYQTDARSVYALKIYNDPRHIDWGRIDALIQLGKSRSSDELPFGSIAWPIEVIYEKSQKVGVLLSLYDKNDHLVLDDWIEGASRKKLPPQLDSLPTKLRIAQHISDLIAHLHDNKIAIIDLKPSNLLVCKSDLRIIALDVDSFGFVTPDGKKYPPTHVSVNYIDPASYGPKMDIGLLWHEQDQYALSVIIFQLLNQGIHPFQCILSEEIPGADTNDEKATMGLYAYATQPHPQASPFKTSVHSSWPEKIRALFDQSFMPRRPRPTASKWRDTLNNILSNKELESCRTFPADPRHIRFLNCACPVCLSTIASKSKPAKPTSSVPPVSQPAPTSKATKTAAPPTSSQTAKHSGGVTWSWIIVAIIIVVLIMVGASKPERRPYAPPPPSTKPSTPLGNPSAVLSHTDQQVCRTALNLASTATTAGWDISFPVSIEEAKRRGYTPYSCHRLLYPAAATAPQIPPPETPQQGTETDYRVCAMALNLQTTTSVPQWDTKHQLYIEEAKRRGFTPASCSNLIKLQGGGSGQYGSGAITPNIPTKPSLPSNTGAFSSGMARITQAVNMRAQGNASASVMRVLREGEIVEVLSQAPGGWVQIRATVSDGYIEGYVYGTYLSLR